MKRISVFIVSCFSFFLLLPLLFRIEAVTVRSGDNVSIPQDSTIDETVLSAGQVVTINGNVNGDVICAGQNLRIEGDVNGDVICAGQNLRIEGRVLGDVRYAGQSLVISGVVERNVTFLGQDFLVDKDGQINGEIISAGESVDVQGAVGKNIAGAMQSLTIAGAVNGKVDVQAQNVSLLEDSSIGGDLLYRAPKEAVIADGATVSGKISYSHIEPRQNDNKDFAKFIAAAGIVSEIISLISATILALAIAILFPRMTTELISAIRVNKLTSFGWGLVVLFLTPIVAIFLLLTIIGIPLALFLGLVWILAIILGKAIAGIYFGFELLTWKKKTKKVSAATAALIGVPVLGLITLVPLVGWLVSFAALCMGLGAIFLYFRRFVGK